MCLMKGFCLSYSIIEYCLKLWKHLVYCCLRKYENHQKKNVVKPKAVLKIKSANLAYITVFPVISMMGNLEVVQEYIKMDREKLVVF